MPADTKAVVLDVNGTPAPQFYDPDQDLFDYSTGADGLPAFRQAPGDSGTFACPAAETPAGGGNYIQAKGSPGCLYGVTVTNPTNAAVYILVFDSAAATPAGLNNPRFVFLVQPFSSQYFAVGSGFGKAFTTGILIGTSTSAPAYTGSSNCWIMADVA